MFVTMYEISYKYTNKICKQLIDIDILIHVKIDYHQSNDTFICVIKETKFLSLSII